MFDSHDLTDETEINVYNQCLLPISTRRNETWTLYDHQIRQIRTIQQRHLRNILKIKWDQALTRAGLEDMEIKLVRNRLRWLGHVS